jgi:glycosyltransferase involved in cell wall biosynthesis
MDLLFAESTVAGWGTEQHFAAMAIAMARHAHRVRCLITAGSVLEAPLRASGVQVLAADQNGGGTLSLRRTALLNGIVSRDRPEWMITNDSRFYWPLILQGRLRGVRTALFRHWDIMSRSYLSRRLLPRLADRFILVSEFQREHFRRDGVDVSRMQILYNPVDTLRLSPSPEARARVRASLGLDAAQPVIGYVGRIVEHKGIFKLLEAAQLLLSQEPTARILWVGDGRDLPRLRAAVAQSAHPQSHIFYGWSDELPGVYNAIDLLAVPSHWPEPFGRVSVEAQACGTPVVCSDAGGLPETLQPGVTGLLVPRGDAAQLAAALVALTHDPARRSAMGLAARTFACASFSFDRIADSFAALLADDRRTPQVSRSAPVEIR